MMPGVGLYLPNSLHRTDAQSHDSIEKRSLTQLHRQELRSSQDTDMSPSQRSIDQGNPSAEDESVVSNQTTTVFNYADFVFASSKRSAEAELFASLVWRTRQDLTEASRLYLSPIVSAFLESWPDRKAWIDKVLSDIRTALVDIGAHIESVRSSRDDDEMSRTKRKFEYTLSHQKRLAHKQQVLANSHQVLLGAIQVMQTVEQCVGLVGSVPDPIFEAPVRPWLRSDSDIIRAPYSRQSSSRNLSALSLTASETVEKSEMRYSNVPLAELPGSTPDDLLDTKTRDPSKYMRAQRSHSYNLTRVESFTDACAPLRQMGNLSQGEHETPEPETSHMSISNIDTTQEGAENDQADRKSTYASSSLNAVVDRIIERTQSIASTTASIRIPALARRYRPRRVNVPNPHLRHHSLPSTLPLFQSQPSLEDDLRDWMVQTAASDGVPEIDLTRSPTVSSTAGSIASRHEMMKILASIPNFDEDDRQVPSTESGVRSPSMIQDDADTNMFPPSAPNSPPTASELTQTQEDTVLMSSFPLPPSQHSSSMRAVGPAPLEQNTLSAVSILVDSIATTPPMEGSSVASEVLPTGEDEPSPTHPQDDIILAASLPLPASQPNSPPMASEIIHPPQLTPVPRRRSALTRKPLPGKQGSLPTQWSEISSELATESLLDGQSTRPSSDPPKQPNHPPPPLPAMTPPVGPAQSEYRERPRPSADLTTTPEIFEIKTSSHPKLPPSVPFFDETAQLSTPPQILDTPGLVSSSPAASADTNTEAAKPRTAEEKRRAAHARRMKLAFGE